VTAAPSLRVIGTVHTRHTALDDTPIQSSLNPDDGGTIELDSRYRDALDGLEEFTHAWRLTWLAPVDAVPAEPQLKQVPFLLKRRPRELGILATRGPRRPNPIGLSLVRLIAIDDTTIRFAGVDVLDGTALLDIKPYVERFDRPATPVRCGWFDSVVFDGHITPSSLEPTDGASNSAE
jgi:tRNA-Thr(GGU) m(6)t(6)A37 methyltransferase TsaA